MTAEERRQMRMAKFGGATGGATPGEMSRKRALLQTGGESTTAAGTTSPSKVHFIDPERLYFNI